MKKNIELLMAMQFADLAVSNLDAVMKDNSLSDKEFNAIREAHDSIASAHDIIERMTKPQRRVSAEAKENGYDMSDGDRIREALIHFFSNSENTSFEYWEGIPKKEVLAWLKQQKEQIVMDYEKKYKDALAWVESIYPELNHEHQMEAEALFPKLKDSKDDEEIVKLANEYYYKVLIKECDMKVEEAHHCRIAYIHGAKAMLEKQGQNSIQEMEPFEAEHGKYYYCIKDYFCGGRKQASKGDVVQALRGLPIMGLKDASEYFLPVNSIKCNSAWSKDYTERMGQIINYLICQAKEEPTRRETLLGWVALLKSIFRKGLPEIQIPCTEAARKGIHRIMDVLDWAADKGRISDSDCEDYMILLSAYLPQPKQEWSEKDEEKLNSTISLLKEFREAYQENAESCINWLKLLKPNHWKPSKEQMDAMQMAVSYFGYSWVSKEQKLLESLYKDLKKL